MFSRKFIDSQESNETAAGLMNLHNNEAGRRVSMLFLKVFDQKRFLNRAQFFIKNQGVKIANATRLQMPWCVWFVFDSCLLETLASFTCCGRSIGPII